MLKRIREMFKNEKGLTLVELLAVIVILAIVGAIAFVMIGNIIENSKKDAAVADAIQAIESAKLYEIEKTGETSAFTVTVENLQGGNENPVYLDSIYDPWTKGAITEGQVEKDSNGYKATIDFDGCEIDHREEVLIETGREVCD